MNDTELDEMLNDSKVPPVPASLRKSIIRGFRARFGQGGQSSWRRMTAFLPRLGQIAALSLLALVLTKTTLVLAFSTASQNSRYTAETENNYYAADGSSTVEIYTASYDMNGDEVPFSRTVMNDHLATLEARAMDLIRAFHSAMGMPVHGNRIEPTSDLSSLRKSGCAAGSVSAPEKILNHPTVVSQALVWDNRRLTTWLAPDLGCFPLRYTVEAKQPDGAFRLTMRNQILEVKVNQPSVVTP